jgi:thiamine biosynthesis lipoprotein ApbE
MYKETDGVFNILVGEHLNARGYDAEYSFKPKDYPATIPSPKESLSITHDRVTLAAGLLDLGGFGKGYAIDLLAARLKEKHQLNYFLINGGGDMYATSDHAEAVEIYLEHPIEAGTYIAKTTLKDQGFAASSTHKRRWEVAGREYSHIIDTSNKVETSNGRAFGAPDHTPDNRGVYTKAPTAALADAWATTLLLSPLKYHQTRIATAKITYANFNTRDNTLVKSRKF